MCGCQQGWRTLSRRGPGLSWQEELRRLDEELAAGRITADDYRLRRDSVLSQAVNLGPQSTPAGTGQQAESTQIIAPVAGMPGQQPPPPQGPSADQTQIVNPSVADGSERTQAVSGGAPVGWTGGDAERTQVVPGVPPQAVAGHFRPQGPDSGGFPSQQQPYQQQQPWSAAGHDAGTPWGGGDFGPPPADTSWVAQGPEASFETKPSGGAGKKVAIIAAVVVVLAGLGVGGYFLFSGGSGGGTAEPTASPTTSAPPTITPKPKDDLEVAKLPGSVKETTNFSQFADFAARKVLTDEENTALTNLAASAARMSVSELPSGAKVVVVTVMMPSAANAGDAQDKLTQLQTKYKLIPFTGTAPQGVEVQQLDGDGKALIRAHYVHKNTIVRVQVNGADKATVSQVFDEIITKQLEALPISS